MPATYVCDGLRRFGAFLQAFFSSTFLFASCESFNILT